MKISICIPQYNRAKLLVKALRILESQTYTDIEVVVSDDCSTDDTVEQIEALKKSYKYPVIFSVNERNTGYDRNYRKCIELATGDYCFVIGNDDTLYEPDAITFLVDFLKANDYPDIGYCNYVEENNPGVVVERALSTRVHGSGVEIAVKHYNGFSFVGGLIYKKTAFDKYNTAKHDGSIYSQMYLGLLMIASGCKLFTIQKALVLKDLHNEDGSFRWSYYRDGLPKSRKEYRVMDGGLPSVANVLISACEDAMGKSDNNFAFRILKRVYGITFPFWVVQYKKYGSFFAALGLIDGIMPSKHKIWTKINSLQKIRLFLIYVSRAFAGILMPVFLFDRMQFRLQKAVKRSR